MQYIPNPADLDPSPEPSPVKTGNGAFMAIMVVIVIAVAGLGAWKLVGAGGDAWHHDLTEGITEAESLNRPALVLFTADWCPPCRMLKKDILTEPSVAQYLDANYVRIKIDLTERGGPNSALAQKWDVRSIPNMIVFDPDGNEIDSLAGAPPAEHLRAWLETCRAQVR